LSNQISIPIFITLLPWDRPTPGYRVRISLRRTVTDSHSYENFMSYCIVFELSYYIMNRIILNLLYRIVLDWSYYFGLYFEIWPNHPVINRNLRGTVLCEIAITVRDSRLCENWFYSKLSFSDDCMRELAWTRVHLFESIQSLCNIEIIFKLDVI